MGSRTHFETIEVFRAGAFRTIEEHNAVLVEAALVEVEEAPAKVSASFTVALKSSLRLPANWALTRVGKTKPLSGCCWGARSKAAVN
ncbi:MAG TPA: hypothetical protein VGB77_20680 [Abditibacteriaceae bacterium]|jgi:hypothetical protein